MVEKNALLKRIGELRHVLQIGKMGLTDGILDEIKVNLKKHKVIKVKCLRIFVDSLDFEGNNRQKMISVANQVAEKTNSELIQIRGFTITLHYVTSSQ